MTTAAEWHGEMPLLETTAPGPGEWRPGPARLPGTPWWVRLASGSQGPPAVEIYEATGLVDVVVATPVARQILRGARRAAVDGLVFGLAWGRLPADGASLVVTFDRSRLRRGSGGCRPAPIIDIAGWCWLAVAEGRFARVTVAHRDTLERRRLRTGPRW